MSELNKKNIGVCLCIIFAIYALSSIVSRIVYEPGSSVHTIINLWYVVSTIAMAATLLIVAFVKKFNSNAFVKAGAMLLTIGNLIAAINTLGIIAGGEALINIVTSPVGHYLYMFILNVAGPLLFFWGLRTWIFTKIAATLTISADIFIFFNFRKIIDVQTVYDNSNISFDDFLSEIQPAQDSISTGNLLFIACAVIALALNIVWMTRGGNGNNRRVAAPKMPEQEQIINKIPHK